MRADWVSADWDPRRSDEENWAALSAEVYRVVARQYPADTADMPDYQLGWVSFVVQCAPGRDVTVR